MKLDIDRLSEALAADASVTDYDFWRALRIVNHELFAIERRRAPIPIEYLHLRAILRTARLKRRKRRIGV